MSDGGLAAVRIVLVEPLYGGNVGSICRAMVNMGLSELYLVAPRVKDWDEARRMARHAFSVLENRQVRATLDEAVGDCVAVAGTTALGGLYRQHAQTPRDCAPELLARTSSGPVALVFGREDRGLTNEESARCSHLLRIPSGEAYASLNLAQAVMICVYELFTASGTYVPPVEKSALAPDKLRERMFGIWREMLLEIGFMEPGKADHMMQGIRRALYRGAVTEDDVNLLMGVARQSLWAARNRGAS